MLKLIGIISIILCGTAAGFAGSVKLRRQTEYCHDVSRLLHETAMLMHYSCDTLPSLITELSCRECFSQLIFLGNVSELIEKGTPFPRAWEEGIKSDSFLSPELRQLISPLADSLGVSDIEGQLLTLRRAEEETQELYIRTNAQYMKKGRLYRCLGVLGGMSAALLLC